MKTTIKHIIQYSAKALTTILLICSMHAKAQIPANAVNADPAVVSIEQVPSSPIIVGNAVLQFRFQNQALTNDLTGQIPVNSVRLTISFPGKFAYTSVNSIPKFSVEDFDDQPFGVVHLVNVETILEGEQIDLLLNVRGTQTGAGTVTLNADRITPIIVANTSTANDNTQAIFNTTTPLPLKLTSFSAMGIGCSAKISWTTSAEVGLSRFEVLRSTDGGNHFVTVGSVPAAGGAGDKSYSYTDQMQGTTAHLYRLKMIDKDGNFSYSSIARINSGCQSDNGYVRVYPSPARSMVTLNVSNEALLGTKASMIDMSGRIVKMFVINGTATPIPVGDLMAGMYMIRLSDNTTVKFVKE